MENWPLILFLAQSGIACKNYLEKDSSICLKKYSYNAVKF